VTLLPKDRIGVVVLTNSSSPASGIIANIAVDRMLGLSEVPHIQRAKEAEAKTKEAAAKAKAEDEAKHKKDTKPTLAISNYAGQFDHPAYQTLTVKEKDGQLTGDLHGLAFTLKHYHYDIFQIGEGAMKDLKVVYLMNKAGEIDRLSMRLEPAVKDIVFTKRSEEKPVVQTRSTSPRDALNARAKSLELDTPYVPPPGDPLAHHAAGLAKVVCSAVFITGLDADFAAENLGYFVAPYAERAKLGKPLVDRANKTISITLPNGVKRTAKYHDGQGCITYPSGKNSLNFKPVKIKSKLPDSATQLWPMGDKLPGDALPKEPKEIDAEKLKQAIDAAFEPAAGMTAAFVVTYRGRLIGEQYGAGITAKTPLESWSMGKSLTATLLGILVKRGVYKLDQPAPIPEWQNEGDPRARIRIADILNMSSGLRIRAPQDPDYDPKGPYPDHVYYYTGGINAFHYAATRPQQWQPGAVGRYRNTDPVLINYLVRLGVEKLGEEYLSFPQRALFDKLGIRTMVMETDPYGNFLTQGYELASGRDWARLGNLYLQDGVWNGERILPDGFVKFVSTLAPAWVADQRPIYGGFFWINGDGAFPVPKDAYYMAGAGGQTTMIIPSHDLVVVRLGHYKGSSPGDRAFKKALALLMEAVKK
jgi:CubicO group peptidase (beta-lactamase class C family)